ncbi:MAG: TonB-dependent receptor [Deltaproteobacteria bacterium]|nr:TonB-dependent receptor [Deltaproteobacteria bacterium]
MKNGFRILALTAPLIAGGSIVHAETVESPRTPDIVIGAREIQTYGTSFYEVTEALALRAGLTFLSSGDTASEDWILIRGLPRDSSRNVLVLLDDVPLNNAASEGVELLDVPLSQVTRVEVWKPPLPARFGGYHAVIRFVTADPERRHAARAQAAGGSFSTYRADLGGTTGARNLWVALDVGMTNSANLSGLARTPPLETLKYQDRSYWDIAPSLFAHFSPRAGTDLRLVSLFLKGRKQFADDEYRNRWFWNTSLALTQALGKRVELCATLFRSMEDYFLRLKMHPDISSQERSKQGGRAHATIALPLRQSVTTGAEFALNEVRDPQGLSSFNTAAAFLEYAATPIDPIDVTVGVRADASDLGPPDFNPSATVRGRPWRGGVATARWSRSTRWPSVGEVTPGTRLRGESLEGVEAGFRQSFLADRLALGATWFYLSLDREFTIDASTGTYGNSPLRTMSRGLEFDVSAEVISGLRAFASYTLNHVRREGDAIPVAYGPPEHSATAGLFFGDKKTTARLSARYIGSKFGT